MSTCESVTEDDKQGVTDAVFWFVEELKARCIISALPTAGTSGSQRSKMIGEAIVEQFLELRNGMTFVNTEELYLEGESDEVECVETSETEIVRKNSGMLIPQSSTASLVLDENYEPEIKRPNYGTIPLAIKIKAVTLAKEHPNWNLKTLQKKGATKALKSKKDLMMWENDVIKGGTRYDKYQSINEWTFDRFVESRRRYEQVATRTLHQWAAGAALQFSSDKYFSFTASLSWAKKFKLEYRICQTHITKYVSSKEVENFGDIQKVANLFSTQTASLISGFDFDYVINTDQTGCEYRTNIQCTLSHKGEKQTLVAVGSVHKMTHSYTAQYSITASGKLLPKVFLCLQEAINKFGPRVIEEVNRLTVLHKNVYVTCSKSGKLTNSIYRNFLVNILKPYVADNKFCLILDSWSGQTSTVMYDTLFTDSEGQPTCTVKVKPPNCTPICQPCDVYFYRQVKNLISKLQNSHSVLEARRNYTAVQMQSQSIALFMINYQRRFFGR